MVLITTKEAGNKMSRYVVGLGVQVYIADDTSKDGDSKWAERAIKRKNYTPNVPNIVITKIKGQTMTVNNNTSSGNKINLISIDSIKTNTKYKAVKLDSTVYINASNIPNTTKIFKEFGDKKPLMIVDGKIKEDSFDFNSIDPNTIKSINVLKGKAATKKYGAKAENGAIEISLEEMK